MGAVQSGLETEFSDTFRRLPQPTSWRLESEPSGVPRFNLMLLFPIYHLNEDNLSSSLAPLRAHSGVCVRPLDHSLEPRESGFNMNISRPTSSILLHAYYVLECQEALYEHLTQTVGRWP